MSHEIENPSGSPGLSAVREDLAQQFIGLAKAPEKSFRERHPRKLRFAIVAMVVLLVPTTGFALTGGFDRDRMTVNINGNTVKVNGEVISCPADAQLTEDLGFEPCTVLSEPAPAPLGAGSGPPAEGSRSGPALDSR